MGSECSDLFRSTIFNCTLAPLIPFLSQQLWGKLLGFKHLIIFLFKEIRNLLIISTLHKFKIIFLVRKDIFTTPSTVYHVMPGSRVFYSQWSCQKPYSGTVNVSTKAVAKDRWLTPKRHIPAPPDTTRSPALPPLG